MRASQYLVGQKFGFWNVLQFSHKTPKHTIWLCECKCGTQKRLHGSELTRNQTKSCGCNRGKLITDSRNTHKLSHTPLYNVWCGIRRRCYDEAHATYQGYGRLGVKMCPLWEMDYMSFHNWAHENNWRKGLPICRKGDIGDYSPDNCYITTKRQNSRDRKTNKLNMWKARVIRVMKKNHGWDLKTQSNFWGVGQTTISAIINNKIWAQ